MEIDNTLFIWVPLENIGPFKFGDKIYNYVAHYPLTHIPEEYNEKVNWDVYEYPHKGLRIFSENGQIVAISSETILIYNDVNIIGMAKEKVGDILLAEPDVIEQEELIEGPQDVYDYDDLGLQLWVKDNVIIKSICNGKE